MSSEKASIEKRNKPLVNLSCSFKQGKSLCCQSDVSCSHRVVTWVVFNAQIHRQIFYFHLNLGQRLEFPRKWILRPFSLIPNGAEFLSQQSTKGVLFKNTRLLRTQKLGDRWELGGVLRAVRKAFISSVNDFSSSVNINFLFDCTLAFIYLSCSLLFLFGLLRHIQIFINLYLFARRAEMSA